MGEGSEVKHVDEHAKEFGLSRDSIEEYDKAAKNFVKTKEKGNLLFERKNGSIYKYNPRTKEFAIITKDGKIVTYYKTSLRYFKKRAEEYAFKWLYKEGENDG